MAPAFVLYTALKFVRVLMLITAHKVCVQIHLLTADAVLYLRIEVLIMHQIQQQRVNQTSPVRE